MLELKNITYKVKEQTSEKEILKDFSLKFPENKVTVITGHNGSGKSTLVKLIMGILKPSEGEILLDGQNITNLSIDQRANLGVTLAFQQPVRFKGLLVRDLLNIASQNKISLSQACEFLSQVGLCARDYIDREVDDTLSGGELKRIELALSLAKGGQVMLFDEPEAGIDLWTFDTLIDIFKNIKNKTVVIVSHQKKILQNADYILLLSASEKPVLKKKEEIIDNLSSPKCAKLGGANV